MTQSFDDYQTRCASTAVYPDRGTGSPTALAYTALGLGEVGEVQEKVAEFLTKGAADFDEVTAELGDVLWYIAQLAAELGHPLSQIAALRAPTDVVEAGVDAFATYVTAENPTAAAVDVASLNLGLAGDVQGMVKKILRGDPAATRPEYTEKVTARLADVLAAVAVLARATGVSLASIAQGNLTKLADRASRGVLKGAGDHR